MKNLGRESVDIWETVSPQTMEINIKIIPITCSQQWPISCPQETSCAFTFWPCLFIITKFGGLHSLLPGCIHYVWWPNSLLGKISQSLRLMYQQRLIVDAAEQGCFSTWKAEDVTEEHRTVQGVLEQVGPWHGALQQDPCLAALRVAHEWSSLFSLTGVQRWTAMLHGRWASTHWVKQSKMTHQNPMSFESLAVAQDWGQWNVFA